MEQQIQTKKIFMYVRANLGDIRESSRYQAFVDLNHRAFASRGMQFVPGYFDRLKEKDIAHVLLASYEESGPIVGSVLAFNGSIDEDLKLSGVDEYHKLGKIAVDPDYQGNGILKAMLDTEKTIGRRSGAVPKVWRTSSDEANRIYGKYSELSAIVDGYYIHGINLHDIKDTSRAFDLMAKKVALEASSFTH